ncbi:MAG: dihydroxyacetone kinase subunit DhaL [Cyclonatronaceae bacterium]
MLKKQHLITWLEKCHETYESQRQYLTQLDTAIGDADHGNNMYRGFKKVHDQLGSHADKTCGALLKAVAMTLISTVGGASGPLYGTFFLQAGTKAGSVEELTASQTGEVLQAGLEGLKMRGKASVGDKTIVDALEPAVEAFKAEAVKHDALLPALAQAVEAARKGMESTVPMVAKKGRASYLGERSKDHQDPGATSAYLMLKALHEAVQQ